MNVCARHVYDDDGGDNNFGQRVTCNGISASQSCKLSSGETITLLGRIIVTIDIFVSTVNVSMISIILTIITITTYFVVVLLVCMWFVIPLPYSTNHSCRFSPSL